MEKDLQDLTLYFTQSLQGQFYSSYVNVDKVSGIGYQLKISLKSEVPTMHSGHSVIFQAAIPFEYSGDGMAKYKHAARLLKMIRHMLVVIHDDLAGGNSDLNASGCPSIEWHTNFMRAMLGNISRFELHRPRIFNDMTHYVSRALINRRFDDYETRHGVKCDVHNPWENQTLSIEKLGVKKVMLAFSGGKESTFTREWLNHVGVSFTCVTYEDLHLKSENVDPGKIIISPYMPYAELWEAEPPINFKYPGLFSPLSRLILRLYAALNDYDIVLVGDEAERAQVYTAHNDRRLYLPHDWFQSEAYHRLLNRLTHIDDGFNPEMHTIVGNFTQVRMAEYLIRKRIKFESCAAGDDKHWCGNCAKCFRLTQFIGLLSIYNDWDCEEIMDWLTGISCINPLDHLHRDINLNKHALLGVYDGPGIFGQVGAIKQLRNYLQSSTSDMFENSHRFRKHYVNDSRLSALNFDGVKSMLEMMDNS